jgi:hypothetical protein
LVVSKNPLGIARQRVKIEKSVARRQFKSGWKKLKFNGIIDALKIQSEAFDFSRKSSKTSFTMRKGADARAPSASRASSDKLWICGIR